MKWGQGFIPVESLCEVFCSLFFGFLPGRLLLREDSKSRYWGTTSRASKMYLACLLMSSAWKKIVKQVLVNKLE